MVENKTWPLLLYNIIDLEVIFMLELQEVVRKLAERDSVVIQGNVYKVDNVVYTNDGEILKTRLLLKSTNSENKIVIDVDIFAKIYKC